MTENEQLRERVREDLALRRASRQHLLEARARIVELEAEVLELKKQRAILLASRALWMDVADRHTGGRC